MSTPMSKKRKTGNINSMMPWLGKPAATAKKDAPSETTATPSKKQKSRISGFNLEWKKDFPWLLVATDEDGMLCRHCKKYSMQAKNGTDVWVSTPCTTYRRDTLLRHEKSKMHLDASQREALAVVASSGHGLSASLALQSSLGKSALVGAFKCIYWLAKEEIPHTTQFASLLDLAKSLGCDYLSLLKKGENVNYTSQRMMQDMLQCISQQIKQPILDDLAECRYFSLMIDETTDIAVMKQLTIMVRYLKRNHTETHLKSNHTETHLKTNHTETHLKTNHIQTHFLTLVDLPDGKADTIMAALKTFLTENKILVQRLIGLGSDGAAVMVGRKSGVATQLKQTNPELTSIHCIAHRLALASAQASNDIAYLHKFKSIMQQLFKFYQNSAVRMSGLKEIESILKESHVSS